MVFFAYNLDGEIIICNMDNGHILGRCMSDVGIDSKDNRKNYSVDKLLFLQDRNKYQACLISTGADGIVRFWNIHTGSCLMEKVTPDVKLGLYAK